MLHPLPFAMRDHILIYPPDSLLNAWILSWDYHALASAPLRLFDANIFWPARRTLALSEHMLGNLPFFAPVMGATGNPILATNCVVLASFVLSAVTMFALVYYWTDRLLPALVGGFIYAFAPPRIGQLGHMQLLNVQWLPLVLLFGHRFLASGSMRAGLLACGFYVLQVLTSYYVGYIASLLVICYGAYYAVVLPSIRSLRMVARSTLLVLVAAVVIAPLSYPYLLQKRDPAVLAPGRESVVAASADLASSFVSVPRYGSNVSQRILARFDSREYRWEKWLFVGLVPLLLAAISLRGLIRHRPGEAADEGGRQPPWDRHTVRVHVLLVLVCAVMALGPVLVVNDTATALALPYGWFSRHVPGFSSMRVPARFGLMTLLGIAVLAALGVDILLRRLGGGLGRRAVAGQAIFGALVLVGLGIEFHYAPIPMHWIATGPLVPPVYRWLASQPEGDVVLEVPVRGDPDAFLEPRYVYFSVYHWRRLVNGYSGYTPTSYAEISWQIRNLPDRYSIDYLGALGVRHIVVHTALLPPAPAGRWRTALPAGLERVAEFGGDIVYAIRTAEPTRDLHLVPVLADQLPADSTLTVGMLAEGVNRRWWTNPDSVGPTRVTVEWKERAGGATARQDRTIQIPLVIEAGAPAEVGVPVRTPARPGSYLVTLRLPSLRGSAGPVPVDVVTGTVPSSRDSPRLLAATYLLPATLPPRIVSEPFAIPINARNSGRAVWLARSRGDHGAVRLGWRWLHDGEEVPRGSGRQALAYDVPPGQIYAFSAKIEPPRAPGDYVLELGLVSEHFAWFADLGTAPIRLPVRVPATRSPLAPELVISVDRPRHRINEAVRVGYSLRGGERPWTVDAYLHLHGPGGVSWFYDGQQLIPEKRGSAVPMVRAFKLPARTVLAGTLLTLSLAGKPPGTYTWRLALTEASGGGVLADTTTTFQVSP